MGPCCGGIVVFLLYGQRYEIAALPSGICRTARFDSGDAAHQPQYESRCQGTVLQLADCAVEPTGLLCVSMQPVGRLFGVDAVLFTTIHEWTKTTIAAQVQVTVEYTLRSAKTDAILFHRKGTVIYNPNTSSGSVLLNMLGDMLSAALTKEIELGRQCNEEAIGDMPAGGYSPVFGQDGNENAGSEEFSASFFR